MEEHVMNDVQFGSWRADLENRRRQWYVLSVSKGKPQRCSSAVDILGISIVAKQTIASSK
jgi:hypothetical protein